MRSLTKFRSAYLFLNPWQKLFWLHIDQTVCALRLHCIMVGFWFRQKLQITTKRRFYLITFHSYEQCRAYKIREFSQMSHTHVFGQPIKQWMLGQVCTYLSVYLILIPKETMQRYIAKESREPSSRLLSNACRLRWKLRQILLGEDFTLDNTTGMR